MAFFSHLHRAGPAEALALAHLSSEIVAFFSTSSPGRPRGSPGSSALVFWRRGNCGLFFHIFTGQAPRKPWPLRTCLLA